MKSVALASVVAVAAFAQAGKNLSRERGQTEVPPAQLRGNAILRQTPAQWSGLLLDASCPNRSLANLLAPPAEALAVEPSEKQAAGISVLPQVIQAERGAVTFPDTLDHASRYPSASCALTADTTSFALLLPDGELLNLDEGGNTLALEAFQATPAGRQILNGKTGGLKPRARVQGVREGDRLKTQSVKLSGR